MTALATSFALTPVNGTASSVTVQPPACNAGDLLVMAAIGGAAGSVTPSTPSGWTAQSGGGATLGVYTRTATSAETAYTVSFSGACCASVIVATYPASTVTSSFANSGTNVVTYTPSFPGGVTTDQTVLLFGGLVASLTAPDNLSGSAPLNLPATWTWALPPAGPSFTNYSPGPAAVTVGLADFRGSTSNPTLTSAVKGQFFAGFVVLTTTATEPPWLYVTATASGNAGLGTAVTVKALTGADTAANIASLGAQVSAAKGGAPDLAITPVRSGSLIYGAAWSKAPGGAFTPAAGTTFSQNVYDSVNKAAYGTFETTSPVTAGAAVTCGGSGPSSAAVDVALAEILTTSTLTETATAAVKATDPSQYGGPQPSQTAIFTVLPAAGQVLAAMVVAGTQNTNPALGPVTVTVTDSAGSDWTEVISSAVNGSGYAGVWVTQFGVTKPPPPTSSGMGCLFGLRPVPTTGVSPETNFPASVVAREQLLGRKLDIVTTWRNWDPSTETTTAELQCVTGGRLPMLTWPLPANVPAGANAGITAGTYDAIIYGWGQKLAALPGQVLFRPLPDANTDPNFGPSPPTFVTSWQRVWTIIKGSPAQFAALSPACTAGPALGLTNVDFVWSMAHRATAAGGGNLWATYFPGAAYTDWIGLDAYNTASDLIDTLITTGDYPSTSSSHNWYTTYAGTTQPGGELVPLMISETGCREPDDPGVTGQTFSKATWLAQAETLLKNYPAVRALVYTDAALPSGDWRVDTVPGPPVTNDSPPANPTLAAAIALANDPYFGRRLRVLADGAGNLYLLTDPPGS